MPKHPHYLTDPAHFLQLGDTDIEEAFTPFIREVVGKNDPRWRSEERPIKQLYFKLRWKRKLRSLFKKNTGQDKKAITRGYNNRYQKENYNDFLGKPILCNWKEKYFLGYGRGTLRVHQLYHMRSLAKLKPQSVLEVGCGASNHLFALAARFPHINFTGIELTTMGVGSSRSLQKKGGLPESFSKFAPEPLVDINAHQNVDIIQGDAETLPFPNNSFDYVYTSLALEQMESIRERALREIARVGRRWFVFCEPFHDFNKSGVKRNYIVAKNYFAGKVSSLKKYGMKIKFASGNMPTKFRLGVGFVIAEKDNRN